MRSLLNTGLADMRADVRSSGAAPLPVLDLVHLSRQTCGDGALECELLTSFERQASLILARLQASQSAAIGFKADLAHTLKGSARAIGALGVAQKAGEYEEALKQNCSAQMAQRLEQELFDEVGSACRVIAGLLSDR
jgi:HPt (histidine-containing phosphotransfer) domain-containing protein